MLTAKTVAVLRVEIAVNVRNQSALEVLKTNNKQRIRMKFEYSNFL